MRFRSIHPVEVPDDRAEAFLLVLAHHWPAVPIEDLVAAFANSSVYEGELPKSFRANMTSPTLVGLLVPDLHVHAASCVPFKTDVEIKRAHAFALAAGTDQAGLERAWGTPQGFGRRQSVRVDELATAYRERHGETVRDALARRTTGAVLIDPP
jgi:hypothetical protein